MAVKIGEYGNIALMKFDSVEGPHILNMNNLIHIYRNKEGKVVLQTTCKDFILNEEESEELCEQFGLNHEE